MIAKKTESVRGYYTVAACARLLGVTKSAVRYKAMRFCVPMKRIGYQDYISFERLRQCFEQEKEGK